MRSNSGEMKRKRRSPKPHQVNTTDPRYNVTVYDRGKSIFFESQFQKYHQMVRIDSLEEAEISIKRLEDEYNDAKQIVKKRRLVQVTNRAANIAMIGSRNPNYSEDERREMAQISQKYRGLQHRLSQKYARDKKAIQKR